MRLRLALTILVLAVCSPWTVGTASAAAADLTCTDLPGTLSDIRQSSQSPGESAVQSLLSVQAAGQCTTGDGGAVDVAVTGFGTGTYGGVCGELLVGGVGGTGGEVPSPNPAESVDLTVRLSVTTAGGVPVTTYETWTVTTEDLEAATIVVGGPASGGGAVATRVPSGCGNDGWTLGGGSGSASFTWSQSPTGASGQPGPDVDMDVSGDVRAAATGEPVAGICVSLVRQRDSMVVDADFSYYAGHFQFRFPQPGGTTETYVVVATSDCGADGQWVTTRSSPLELTAFQGQNRAAGVELALDPAGRIVGVARDGVTGSAAVPGGAVTAVDPVTGAVAGVGYVAGTYSQNNVVVGGLPAGQYLLGFSRSETYLDQWAPQDPAYPTPSAGAQVYDVTVGQDTPFDATLLNADRITGKVTDAATHQALHLIEVRVTKLSGVWNGSRAYHAYTDGYGNYTVLGMGPGNYSVCFVDANDPKLHAARCWKDKAYAVAGGNALRLSGFGTTQPGINQALPVKGTGTL